MEPFLYLLKINAAIAVFYLIYRICYRSDTFFTLRRYLLLSMLCLSVIYPFLDFSQWFMHSPALTETVVTCIQYMPELTVTPSATVTPAGLSGSYVFWIYGVIAGIFLLRVTVKLLQIVWLRIRCTAIAIEGVQVYRLQTHTSPFSFFRWIFINPEMHQSSEIHEIIAHELVHVRQRHSLDVLLSEILCMGCWINPLAWMLKSEIHRNLEFLVDHQVVKEGIDSKSYQYHLLRLAYHPSKITIANQFNVSPLKERIMMLNAKQSPKMKLVAYTLLLPLALLFVVVNNAGSMIRKMPDGNEIHSVIVKMSGVAAPDETGLTAVTGAVQKKEFEISGVLADAENNLPIQGANIAIAGTDKGTISDKDGKFILKVSEGDRIAISYIGYTGCTYAVENENMNIGTLNMNRKKENLQEIVVVGYGAPKEESNQPSSVNGEEIFVVVEEMPEFPGGINELMSFVARNIKYPVDAQKNGIQGGVICSFVVDPSGTVTRAKVVREVDPSLDSEALRVIYSMPRWKPGKQRGKAVAVEYTIPILFRLNASEKDETGIVYSSPGGITLRGTAKTEDIAIYINGTLAPSSILQTVDPSMIENITVLKAQAIQTLFPESKGKEGVILITTKRATESEKEKIKQIEWKIKTQETSKATIHDH